MDQIKADVKAGRIPKEARPRNDWGGHFDEQSGFGVHLPNDHWMAVFVDKRLQHDGTAQGRKKVFKDQANKPVAYGITELSMVWRFDAEPLTDEGFGLTAYTDKGKAIAAGTGKIGPNGDVAFQIATLYEGVTNAAPLTYKVEGTVKSDGSYQVTGSVSYSPSK